MPTGSANLNILLQQPTRFVVPFIGLFDDSPFGGEARGALQEVVEADYKRAVLFGDAAHPEVALGELLAVGFQQRLAPLRIWAEQPAWCIWFVGIEKRSPMELCRDVESCPVNYPPGAEHVLVVRLADPSMRQKWAKLKLPGRIAGMVLVCENGATKRPLRLLAKASAGYLYAAWVCHCGEGTGNVRKNLLMTPNHNAHNLGVSCCVPDVAYHAERWSGRIKSALLHEWMLNAQITTPSSFEPVMSSIKSIVPNPTGQGSPDYVVASVPPSHEGLPICVAAEDFGISGEFTEASCHRPERNDSSRSRLLSWLSAIKGLSSFLGFATEPNLKRIIEQNATAQLSRWLRVSKEHLGQPADAKGYLNSLRQRLEQTAAWSRDRMKTCVAEPITGGDFQHHERAALAKISAIPSPTGLLLRLSLFGLALGSLAIAPLWVSSGAHAWQAELAQRTAIAAVAFLVLVSVVATGLWYYSAWSAMQGVVQARMSVIKGHLSKVAGMIAGAMAENGRRLGEEVATWAEAFDKLRRHLENGDSVPTAVKVPNGSPFFPDTTLDGLCLKRMPDLVIRAHMAFLSGIDSSALTTFKLEQWKEALSKAAHAVAYAEVSQLTFVEWMAELNPTAEQQRYLIEDIVREARLPTLSMRQPANPPPVAVFGAPQLARQGQGLGQIVFFDSAQKSLMAVSVMPVTGRV